MTEPIEYTTVVGVDERHLRQLVWTWPTWCRHKPGLLDHPMLAFYDRDELTPPVIREVVDHPRLHMVPWPPEGVEYARVGNPGDRFGDPQRHKMLAGFVHVPPLFVETPWWLKLDTDVVAVGCRDWIDPVWFDGDPVMVSHPWSFTKPAGAILELDRWAEAGGLSFAQPPLDLEPREGSDRLGHRRVISWCGFFRTEFSRECSQMASLSCGPFQVPIPSQDTFLWYCAQRMGLGVVRVSMKQQRGWQQWHTEKNVGRYAEEAMWKLPT